MVKIKTVKTKEKIRSNQIQIALAMGIPVASYEAEINFTKIAREASGLQK